jgi:hypothetical protein
MSIYPVRITEWYDNKKSAFYSERTLLRGMMTYAKCDRCGAPMKSKWRTGYVMHSATFGGPNEAWCTKRCLIGDK